MFGDDGFRVIREDNAVSALPEGGFELQPCQPNLSGDKVRSRGYATYQRNYLSRLRYQAMRQLFVVLD